MSWASLDRFWCIFHSAKTEWTAERRRLKEERALFEEAEQKAKDELLRAMANSSQVGAPLLTTRGGVFIALIVRANSTRY